MRHLILFLFAFPSLLLAQNIETRNYDFTEKTPKLHTLTKEEAAEAKVFIKDKRVTEYAYNKNDELEEYFTMHRIVRLNESKSIEEFNKIYVPVSNDRDLISFKARSISKTGVVKEMLRGEMKSITDEGKHYMTLAIDGLETGCEVEYFYIIREEASYYGAQTAQSSGYQRKVELQIISPENIIMELKSYNGFPQFKDTLIGKKHFYSSSMENVAPMNDEKYATQEANKMRVEYKISKNLKRDYSRLLTFADAGNRYYSRLCNYEKQEVKDVEKAVSKLNLKSLSDIEKIRSIESYLKTNFNVQRNADVNNISDVFKKQLADEYQINRLCAAMLKQIGMKFEIVITVSRYDKKFDPSFETWNFLDDIMFYLPTLDKYLQPTNFGYRMDLIPALYVGNSGLFIKEVTLGDVSSAITSVKKIPEPSSSISHDNMDINISFAKDFKEATQHTKRSMAGYVATGLRPAYYYSSEDKKKELAEAIMKTDIDAAKVTNLRVTNYNLNNTDADKDFTLDADLTYSSLIEKADKSFLFKVGAVIGTQEELYQEKPRQNPIELDFPHNLDRTITITIPDGYVAKGLDALKINITGGENNSATMGFISSYTLTGNKLEIKIHEYYDKINYPVTLYEQFRKVINASADFNKLTIVFEKKS